MKCLNCNSEFEPKRTSAKYCSDKCRSSHHNTKREAVSSKFDIINEKLDVVLGVLKSGSVAAPSSVQSFPQPTTTYGKFIQKIQNANTEKELRNVQHELVATPKHEFLGNQYQLAYNSSVDRLEEIYKTK
jgi:hypothetical protein